MIKITCKIDSHDDPTEGDVLVQSHWNDNKMVVLVIDCEERTVSAKDLKAAIDNATNTARF